MLSTEDKEWANKSFTDKTLSFEEFLEVCRVHNFGIAAFNTYMSRGRMRCYIMAAERGNNGRFVKGECYTQTLDNELWNMAGQIEGKW